MKKQKNLRNVRVLAENNKNRSGLNIYLVYSGKREFLMFHRRNGLLYTMLKDGVSIEEWRRMKTWKPHCGIRRGRSRSQQEESVIRHLNEVIEDYMFWRDDSLSQPAMQNPEESAA